MSDLIEDVRRGLTRPALPSSDFDLNPGVVLPEGRKLRPAAVLILLTPAEEVVLTKRAAQLKHHPGQIAFPGGKQDEADATLWDCALREAEEEIHLERTHEEVLGPQVAGGGAPLLHGALRALLHLGGHGADPARPR